MSATESSQDPAKNSDDEIAIGDELTSKEDDDNIVLETKCNETCVTDISETKSENTVDNLDALTAQDSSELNTGDILQRIDNIVDDSSVNASGDMKLPVNVGTSEEMDESADKKIDDDEQAPKSQQPNIDIILEGGDDVINSEPKEAVNKGADVSKVINEHSEKQIIESNAEITNENTADNNMLNETQEKVQSVEVNDKTDVDDDMSHDRLDGDEINANEPEVVVSNSQKSDSNESILLKWDDDDSDGNIKSPDDNESVDDKALDDPPLEQIVEEQSDKTAIRLDAETNSATISNVEQSDNHVEVSKQSKSQHIVEDLDVVITEKIGSAVKDNPLNEDTEVKQSDNTSAMDVDSLICTSNDISTESAKEIQENFPKTSSPMKTTDTDDTKMDVDISSALDESIDIQPIDEEKKTKEMPTDVQSTETPASEKVDVHNPDTSVKEYSVDLSVITGEVNGPERNVDCHDLLQIKEECQNSPSNDLSIEAINTEHGLKKPDMMLEIPTQEFIDFEDSNIDDEDETVDDKDKEEPKTQITSDEKGCTNDQTQKEVTKEKDAGELKEIVTESKQFDVDLVKASSEKATDIVPVNDIDSEEKSTDSEKQITETEIVTVKRVEDIEESIESIAKEIEDQQRIIDQAQPSTSTAVPMEMTPDTADEVPEMSDSLGLLAESVRLVEDDDDDDVFDDEDDQFDECSNQNAAEQSDDSSNPTPSESDTGKDQDEKEIDTPPIEKDGEFDYKLSLDASEAVNIDGDMDVDIEENEDIKPTISSLDLEMETVKLSDTSDVEDDADKKPSESVLRDLLLSEDVENEDTKQSPSTSKKLPITSQEDIVDLEESSSDDDEKQEEPQSTGLDAVTTVNIPESVEVMSTRTGTEGNMSELLHKKGEVVISGVPKPPPHRPARLNTSEVSIKTASTSSTLVIPEKKVTDGKPKMGLEVFNLDSDEESTSTVTDESPVSPVSPIPEETKETTKDKCINLSCESPSGVPLFPANASTVAYFNYKKKRHRLVCQLCADIVDERAQLLVEGMKQLIPILDIKADKKPPELYVISDSDSENESEEDELVSKIGEDGARFLEENLTDMLNKTWKKYNMDDRLKETQDVLTMDIDKFEIQTQEIHKMLDECQTATDKLRNELYGTFEGEKKQLPSIIIFDTPYSEFTLPEDQVTVTEVRRNKRHLSTSEAGAPAKRAAIPLGYSSLDSDTSQKGKGAILPESGIKVEDDRDVSVVQLSAEAAPADLPAAGSGEGPARAPLRPGLPVYAMRNAFGSWLKAKVLECQPKGGPNNHKYTLCRVKFEHKIKNSCKVLAGRCLAYVEPADVRMTIGTRVIALCRDSTNTGKKDSFYSGVVAEIPNPVNSYRYLVFFDDGYAQYVSHSDTRLVCECSPLVWEEVHPFSRDFVKDYLLAYPERPMVRLHAGQILKTEWNGEWWASRVVGVDASLVQVQFESDGRVEWVYRGSTRLAPLYLEFRAAERTRARPLPRTKAQPAVNQPYVEYTRTDEQGVNKSVEIQAQEQQQKEELRRQRAVAKKSTAVPPAPAAPPAANNLDSVTSRVVYYTPKCAVRPLKMVPHVCSPKCKRTDVLGLKELRTYNPLAKPLLSGWERQIVRFKGQKEVAYVAPCGRRVRSVRELHRYLRATRADTPVDLFDFHPATHCLAEFVLNKCIVGKKDLSHGKENVPVPCVNYYDDSLPEFCSYNTERTPTAGVPLNLDPEFLCGCDCTDDCADKTKCACWKLTLEGARTIGLEGPNVGYSYKRLPEPLPSGIYECNSRCKCKHTCLNRVAQHPLQLKLQVFKTLNRGWGIRALNDVPKGAFLCVYAGNLLTDATANLDGLNEGDEYLAELDYIEVVEQMKEGFEEDIPEADKKLDKKESKADDKSSSSEELSSEDDDETPDKNDDLDDDFSPGYIGPGPTEFNKRLRRRGRGKKGENEEGAEEKEKKEEKNGENPDEECITISDDEEVRQPSRFTAQAGMGGNLYVPKYKSVRAHFGKDEACYIMDAKVQGNIGRYLNHSCSPNVFVQNVFVDTHDPRFPWVAFFALAHIRAGTELTWNYNYDIGSVPEKVLYCFCGAPNCRRRLL